MTKHDALIGRGTAPLSQAHQLDLHAYLMHVHMGHI